MQRTTALVLLAGLLPQAPAHAQAAGAIDGATLEVAWPAGAGAPRDLHGLHFRNSYELDAVALCGERALLAHHPGRFDLVYELATGVRAIATVRDDSARDAVLTVGTRGLELLRFGPGGVAATSVATGPWRDATELWAHPFGPTTRVCAYDPVGSRLLVGDLAEPSWSELAPILVAAPVRELEAIEWTASVAGPELAWRFDEDIFVTPADGSSAFVWYPATPGDRIAVARGGPEDVLVWTSSWFGSPVLYARGETALYTPYALGPAPRSDLLVLDRDGDGLDDVVVPSAADATCAALRRGAATFAPFADGDRVQLTATGGELPQNAPVVVGTTGDFDNDGTPDLFVLQQDERASQYLCRPEFEERWRPSLADEDDLAAGRAAGRETLTLQLTNPYWRPFPTYHVQAFALDWTTGALDEVPLADVLRTYDTATAESPVSVSYDLARLPERYAVLVLVAQVDALGTDIRDRRPTRCLYYSPDEEIEQALAAAPYPPNTDPLDPGNGTGGRLVGRAGSGTTGSEPPP